jgi:hypothetical protein
LPVCYWKAEAELGGDTARGLFALRRDGPQRSPWFIQDHGQTLIKGYAL